MGYNSGSTTAKVSGSVAVGLPENTALQNTHWTQMRVDATLRQVQIATPDATHDVYYCGHTLNNNNAASPQIAIYDATAGASPAVAAGSSASDTNANIAYDQTAAQGVRDNFPLIPIKVTNGLRLEAGGAGAVAFITIYYMIIDV